ncbi:MAG: ABC transporter substrate-binding protein [Rhodospirillales bacterium]
MLHTSILILLAFSLPVPASAESGNEPGQVVESFQENLIEVMKKAGELGVKGRYERLAPIIDASFHLPLMARITTLPYWKKSSPGQRDRLIAAFRRMSISTLATLFDGYGGQIFKPGDIKPGPQKTLIVETRLVDPDKSFVDIAYVTKKINDHWRIIDVILDKGISELTVRRSEYRRLLKTKGVEGLIAALNNKADQLISQ